MIWQAKLLYSGKKRTCALATIYRFTLLTADVRLGRLPLDFGFGVEEDAGCWDRRLPPPLPLGRLVSAKAFRVAAKGSLLPVAPLLPKGSNGSVVVKSAVVLVRLLADFLLLLSLRKELLLAEKALSLSPKEKGNPLSSMPLLLSKSPAVKDLCQSSEKASLLATAAACRRVDDFLLLLLSTSFLLLMLLLDFFLVVPLPPAPLVGE